MKDITIRRFLKNNIDYFNENKIEIIDYGVDLCSIRLKRENREVYINTISYHNSKIPKKQNKDYIGIDLEIIDEDKTLVLNSLDDLTEEVAMVYINNHFSCNIP